MTHNTQIIADYIFSKYVCSNLRIMRRFAFS